MADFFDLLCSCSPMRDLTRCRIASGIAYAKKQAGVRLDASEKNRGDKACTQKMQTVRRILRLS